MDKSLADWILSSSEPWTRLRARLDLLGASSDDPEVVQDRYAMMGGAQVQSIIREAKTWPGSPIRRHNDASHPLYKLIVLTDFGINPLDFDSAPVIQRILAHQTQEGAFCSLMNISTSFGGSGEDTYAWMGCDAPVLLYILLGLGVPAVEPPLRKAFDHLLSLCSEKGWGCSTGGVGSFRGPGRKADPCPMANLLALKALACVPELQESQQVRWGLEMLLNHWEARREKKYYLFGIGTDFHKLKYPFIWYDILHVCDVLRRFPFIRPDPRFQEMLSAISAQMDSEGRFNAGSMYQHWKCWSFADKKSPSPWISLLAHRCLVHMSSIKFS